MAEETNDQLAKEIIGSDEPAPDNGPAGKGLIWIAIAVAVALACTGAGYFLGSLLRTARASSPGEPAPADAAPPPSASDEQDYHEMPSFIVTLNTPRRDRQMQITLVLAMKKSNKDAVTKMLDKRRIELTSKLTLYLNGRTIEDVSGDKNLHRILREIKDMVNDTLWGDRAPMIEQVHVKSLAVQ